MCTWCCGCCYIFFAFFVGGILTAISVPLASICLILDDVNGQMLDDISGVLNVNFTGDSGVVMKDTIDQCFRNPNPAANPYLLDIIFTRNATTNERETLRKTIVDDTKTSINAEFDALERSLQTDSVTLNNNTNIVSLKNTLKTSRMDAMMYPPASYSFATSPYADMAIDTQYMLSLYWLSSAACDDFPVPPSMGSLSGQTVKGIKNFSTSLAHFGIPIVNAADCGKKVTCTDGTSKPCNAANLYMGVKQDLRTIQTFKCRRFEKDNGDPCDIINMVEVPANSGNYSGTDCLRADGTMKAQVFPCTLAQFTQQVQDFERRLDKVFIRVDGASQVTQTKINVNMRGLVDTHILKKIDTVADGLTCGFLGMIYQLFVDGTCYLGIWGFVNISKAYVGCACLCLILVVQMYVVWRISIDNYNETAKIADSSDNP